MTQPFQISKLLVAADYEQNFRITDHRGKITEELREQQWPECSIGTDDVKFRNTDTLEDFVITTSKTHFTLLNLESYKVEKELIDRIAKQFSTVFKILKITSIYRVGTRFEGEFHSEKACRGLVEHYEGLSDYYKSFFEKSRIWKYERASGILRSLYKKGPYEIGLFAVPVEEGGLVRFDIDFYRHQIKAANFKDFVRMAFKSLKDVGPVLEGDE